MAEENNQTRPRIGDTVYYMLKRGPLGLSARAAVVVEHFEGEHAEVNLLVFLDGMNDALYINHKVPGFMLWVTGVPFDDGGDHHTWHFRES